MASHQPSLPSRSLASQDHVSTTDKELGHGSQDGSPKDNEDFTLLSSAMGFTSFGQQTRHPKKRRKIESEGRPASSMSPRKDGERAEKREENAEARKSTTAAEMSPKTSPFTLSPTTEARELLSGERKFPNDELDPAPATSALASPEINQESGPLDGSAASIAKTLSGSSAYSSANNPISTNPSLPSSRSLNQSHPCPTKSNHHSSQRYNNTRNGVWQGDQDGYYDPSFVEDPWAALR